MRFTDFKIMYKYYVTSRHEVMDMFGQYFSVFDSVGIFETIYLPIISDLLEYT